MNKGVQAIVLGVGAALLGGATAQAHPHVFAEAKVEIVGTDDGKLGAVRNIWRMDELFSSSVLVDFDADADGALGDEELSEIGSTVRQSIAEWNFYTRVAAGAREVQMSPPDEIRALWQDGQLLMFFEMKAAEPVDLAVESVTVSNFDKSFFVAFEFSDVEDFQLVDMPTSCEKTFVVPDEDEAARQWMDSVASLGPDESIPDEGINYSEALATRIEVACAPAS